MPSKFVDETSRNFNSTSAPGLSDEARRAVNAAFDAMSAWRTETVNSSEKSFEQVTTPPVRKCKPSPKCRSKRWIA